MKKRIAKNLKRSIIIYIPLGSLLDNEETKMKSLLTFLSGKKSTIVAFIGLTTSFLVLKEMLDVDTSVYINSITVLLAYGASKATGQLVYGK